MENSRPNTQKFTGKADIYQKYRPDYPDELYEYLCKYYLPYGGVVADVGAGTGKFAKGFLSRKVTTFCVEPNADMARVLSQTYGDLPNFKLIPSPAEDIPLPEKSVDLITAAQAFHWFDAAAFYACCKKILKEGGVVALIWNMRDRDEAEQALYALDLKYYAHNFKGRSGGVFNGDNSSLREFFKDGYSKMRFENGAFSYTEEEFVGRRLTSSYALKEGDEKYGEYVDALKEHFKKFSAFGKYVEHIQTHLYYGRI